MKRHPIDQAITFGDVSLVSSTNIVMTFNIRFEISSVTLYDLSMVA